MKLVGKWYQHVVVFAISCGIAAGITFLVLGLGRIYDGTVGEMQSGKADTLAVLCTTTADRMVERAILDHYKVSVANAISQENATVELVEGRFVVAIGGTKLGDSDARNALGNAVKTFEANRLQACKAGDPTAIGALLPGLLGLGGAVSEAARVDRELASAR